MEEEEEETCRPEASTRSKALDATKSNFQLFCICIVERLSPLLPPFGATFKPLASGFPHPQSSISCPFPQLSSNIMLIAPPVKHADQTLKCPPRNLAEARCRCDWYPVSR